MKNGNKKIKKMIKKQNFYLKQKNYKTNKESERISNKTFDKNKS